MVEKAWKRSGIAAVAALILVAGCTAGPNPLAHTEAHVMCCTELGGNSAGFWLGVWHGLISPVMFFVSLFSSTMGVYEVHNNGGWYNAGFWLGISTILGGSGRAYYARKANSDSIHNGGWRHTINRT